MSNKYSIVFSLLVSVMLLPVDAYAEAKLAFADTHPGMSFKSVIKRQLMWQRKNKAGYSEKNCTRGAPYQWFPVNRNSKRVKSSAPTDTNIVKHKLAVVEQKYFKLSAISSLELVNLSGRRNLVVLHQGCEFYTILVRFEFSRSVKRLADAASTWQLLLVLLNDMSESVANDKKLFKQTIAEINRLSKKQDLPNYGEWLRIPGTGQAFLQSQFTLSRVGLIKAKRGIVSYGYIEFGFTTGPL